MRRDEITLKIPFIYWEALEELEPAEALELIANVSNGVYEYQESEGYTLNASQPVIEADGTMHNALNALYCIFMDTIIKGLEEDKAAQEARREDSGE